MLYYIISYYIIPYYIILYYILFYYIIYVLIDGIDMCIYIHTRIDTFNI